VRGISRRDSSIKAFSTDGITDLLGVENLGTKTAARGERSNLTLGISKSAAAILS
jgi:hypothetical protein